LACTNLIEGGKLDKREQAISYTNRGVAFRFRGGVQRALADLNRAIELDSSLAPICANRGLVYPNQTQRLPISTGRSSSIPTTPFSTSTAVYQRLNNAMAYADRRASHLRKGSSTRR